jgi:glycosyltransferase involved in cell wall biosynthesis
VLVTPARNEVEHIGATVVSVLAQTLRPLRWVIVSDGSTDGTDELVRRLAAGHDWIRLLRMPERRERHFAGKVHAFNAGLAALADLDYELIASLDADITLGPDHFVYLLQRFAEDPRLGVAGTPFCEDGRHYDYRFTNIEHVSGACQVFRRACFEQIGGYQPVRGGGIDWIAVTTARMRGWQHAHLLRPRLPPPSARWAPRRCPSWPRVSASAARTTRSAAIRCGNWSAASTRCARAPTCWAGCACSPATCGRA